MGALAEAILAYAQPLIDQTDGSMEELNKALSISQFCYNLSPLSDHSRDTMLNEMRRTLEMDDEQFATFQRLILVPMLQRHQEMFPLLHRRMSAGLILSDSPPAAPSRKASPGEKYPGTDRYAPCPCGSGQKYKFCCGAKGR